MVIYYNSASIIREERKISISLSRSASRWAGSGNPLLMHSSVYSIVSLTQVQTNCWQYSTNALKNLKTLAVVPSQSIGGGTIKTVPKSNIPDCCICTSSQSHRQNAANPPTRPIWRKHPSGSLHRPLLAHLPLQMHPTAPRVAPPCLFVPPLSNFCGPRRGRRSGSRIPTRGWGR